MATAIFGKLAPVFQADAVVTRRDVTVRNAYVARMVEVYSVAIPYFQVVQKLNTINHSSVTSDKMHRPISPFFDGDITNGEVSYVDKRQHMRSRIERRDGSQIVTVREFTAHEANAIAMDCALTRDG